MSRAALLLHTFLGGESHFDWLTASADEPDAPLVAFRVGMRVDDPLVLAFDAEPLPDHRAVYLEYEGPLEPKEGRERGSVVRLARGEGRVVTRGEDLIVIEIDWSPVGASRRRYEGRSRTGGLFRFIVTEPGASDR